MCNSFVLIRVFTLAFLLAGLVSMASAPKNVNSFNSLNASYYSTRAAYLVIIILAFIASAALFVLQVFGVIKYNRIYWIGANLFIDAFFLCGVIPVSIVSAIREGEAKESYYTNAINRGTFTASAIFGLFACVSYISSILTLIAEALLLRPTNQGNFLSRIVEKF